MHTFKLHTFIYVEGITHAPANFNFNYFLINWEILIRIAFLVSSLPWKVVTVWVSY